MKKLSLLFVLLLLIYVCSHAQIIKENDTLYLNYSIASNEFGNIEEGIIIYKSNNQLNAVGVRYNQSSTEFILNAYAKLNNNNHIVVFGTMEWYIHIKQLDSITTNAIIDFYKKNRNNYTVIKSKWILSKYQCEYIAKIIDEIRTRPFEKNAFSNSSEHYVVSTKQGSYVFLDKTGKWNKFLEIKKILEIEQ